MPLPRPAAFILRDPLAHFLLAAAALFVLHSAVTREAAPNANRIEVTRADILTYMQNSARAYAGEPFETLLDELPDAERRRLIDGYVREEALYRRAKALDLDKENYAARLRLVKQLEFILQSTAQANASLSESEVDAFYNDYKSDFAEPALVTFSQVYFAARDETARQRAEETLARLNAEAAPFDAATAYGDRPLYHQFYARRDRTYIASHFGDDFADAVFSFPAKNGRWQGPVRSARGWHLVQLTAKTETRTPELDEIRAEVEDRALAARQASLVNDAITSIAASFEVTVDEALDPAAPEPGS